ncbi:MAG: hypothetical protein J6113_07220, partial [Lachnospiraceae bacterium]|nr:hypothetical protein [Lachnospiraceae bacterium]
LTGYFLKWSYPSETNLFDGMGIKVEVVDFQAGNTTFTCKLTGKPKKSGNGKITIKLFEADTSAGVRMSSKNPSGKTFGFSTPDETTTAYISTQTFEGKVGFMLDTSDTPTEIELTQGYSTSYRIRGSFTKDQDVSHLLGSLPGGIKAYAAETVANTATLRIYFKGVPTAAGTKKIYAELSGSEYEVKPQNGSWSSSTSNTTQTSDYTETQVTINITTASEFGFAYSFVLDRNGDGTVASLPYEALKAAVALEPINLLGGISSKQFVKVQNGNATISTDSVYTGTSLNLWLYIPQITFTKAYSEDQYVQDDLIRLKRVNENGSVSDAPVTGLKIVTETALAKGKQTGVNILVYIESTAASATPCLDGLLIQINDDGTWKNVVMPTGSKYDIVEVITGDTSVSLSEYNGLSASVADCSINGISWAVLWDKKGVEITLTGATFRYMHKGQDVSSWFTNLPEGLSAVVREDAAVGSDKVNIRFGIVNKRTGKITTVTPTQTSTEAIGLKVPFTALKENKFDLVEGYIFADANENARYNILESSDFGYEQKIMVVSAELTGVYNPAGGIGDGYTDEIVFYVPKRIVQEDKPFLYFTFNMEGLVSYDVFFGKTESTDYYYRYSYSLYRPGEQVPGPGSGAVTLSEFHFGPAVDPGNLPQDGQRPDEFLQLLGQPYITYNIAEPGTVIDTGDDAVIIDDDNGDSGDSGDSGNSGNPAPSGQGPQIWVNGKDTAKENIFHKTFKKAVADLIGALETGCKYIVSVTETSVTDAAAAFPGGKGLKSDTAKASYKAKTGTVDVVAGKKAGTVRVWIASYNSKTKEIKDSGYFDIEVGVAPKKVFVAKESGAAPAAAVKGILLNLGEKEQIFANGPDALSPYSTFTWVATKGAEYLKITPSGDTQSAQIEVVSTPTNGKVFKATVVVTNVESGKKVNLSVSVVNETVRYEGMDEELVLDSAVTAAVQKQLEYTPVCHNTNAPSTDKVKVYTTTNTTDGMGYSVTNNKFKLLEASKKVKATLKNGVITLKAAKKTEAGTKLRVIIVVTHADKTVDIFESAVITVGKEED